MADITNLRVMEEVIMVIGSMGSDAGYSVLTPHGVIHVPGNNPMAREAYEKLVKCYAELQQIALKEQPGAMGQLRVARG